MMMRIRKLRTGVSAKREKINTFDFSLEKYPSNLLCDKSDITRISHSRLRYVLLHLDSQHDWVSLSDDHHTHELFKSSVASADQPCSMRSCVMEVIRRFCWHHCGHTYILIAKCCMNH